MNHGQPRQRPARHRGLGVPRNFSLRHPGIMFERQRCDGLGALAAPANAAETHDGADIGAPLRERGYLLRDVEIGLLNTDGHSGGYLCIAMLVKRLNRRSSAGKKETWRRPATMCSILRGPWG